MTRDWRHSEEKINLFLMRKRTRSVKTFYRILASPVVDVIKLFLDEI